MAPDDADAAALLRDLHIETAAAADTCAIAVLCDVSARARVSGLMRLRRECWLLALDIDIYQRDVALDSSSICFMAQLQIALI